MECARLDAMESLDLSLRRQPDRWRIVFAALLGILALVAFWPDPVDQPVQGQLGMVLGFLHSKGIPSWVDYAFVESAANVVLFIPVGYVYSIAYPASPWWQVGALGLLISGCIEFGQLVFLDNRFSSPSDLAMNSVGALLGAFAAAARRQTRIRNDERSIRFL